MGKIQFVGDVHGEFQKFKDILNKSNGKIIQLGDLGIGFIQWELNPLYCIEENAPYMIKKYTNFTYTDKEWYFCRGNHDNPEICRAHPNYLGDYGYTDDGIFFISGALSIDKEFRTIGRDWWEEEELTTRQCNDAIELYSNKKPEIVISHDCPRTVSPFLVNNIIPSRTGQILDQMLNEHQPTMWIFAHYHLSWYSKINKTDFRCLNTYESFYI